MQKCTFDGGFRAGISLVEMVLKEKKMDYQAVSHTYAEWHSLHEAECFAIITTIFQTSLSLTTSAAYHAGRSQHPLQVLSRLSSMVLPIFLQTGRNSKSGFSRTAY